MLEAQLQGNDNLFIKLINADVDTLCEEVTNSPGIAENAKNVVLSKVFRMDGANKSFVGVLTCVNRVNERDEIIAFSD